MFRNRLMYVYQSHVSCTILYNIYNMLKHCRIFTLFKKIVWYLQCFKILFNIYNVYNVLQYCTMFTMFYNTVQYLQCFIIL